MDFKTILENWQKFAQNTKPLTITESREIMSEVSQAVADRIYDWMAETEGLAYDFGEIFGDNMRVTFPLDSEDTRMLKAIMRGIKAAGWLPPISEDARDLYRSRYAYEKNVETGQRVNPDTDEDWEPSKEEWKAWEATQIDPKTRAFPTKKVKQKRQRLAADGGGEYEVEIDVADLTMERRVTQVIPKGPRAGEEINKVQKQGINKIIGGLEKKGEVPEGASDWWAKNQTHYTKDNNHKKISQSLIEGKSENMHVILSRHPIDVLRMSDISNIRSCHSEGNEYFQCAVAEAKGHGPIAYAVTEAELNKLLTPSEEREKPIAKLDRMYDTMGQAERITQIRQDYDTESPEGALVLLWVWSRSNTGTKWWNDLDKRVEMAAKPEKFKEVALISKAKELNISPELFKQYIKNYEDAKAAGLPGFKPYDGITSEEEYKAALQKHSEEATRASDKVDISSFDDEEIFRDKTRGIEGIGASARVRLRKYVDAENDLTFAAPESRTYGRGIPGFVAAVREHVWDKQKGLFAQELGDAEGEATTYFVPDEYNLTRYGGSYGDTRDGEILSMFWNLAGDEYEDRFDYGTDVEHDSGEEEEEEAGRVGREYSEAIDDLNDTANNELENASFSAYVHEGDWGDQPYVSADGTLTLTIDLGWKDGGNPTQNIPEYNWRGEGREFANSTLDLPSEYPEEVDWELTEDSLQIDYRFTCEDCSEPNDAEYFLDYMRELDGKYDQFYEIIRKRLVEEGYAKASAWDDTTSEIEDFEDRLKNFNVIGDDDDDPTGEIWFNLGRGTGNGDPDMPLDIKINREKVYWLTKHPMNTYSTISRSVIKNQFGQLMASAISGRKERRVVWVGPDTNSAFAKFFADKLKKLESAANGYAEKQLDLPFGDKYARPEYEGVDFAKDVQLGLIFGESGDDSTELPIFFRFRVIIRSKDTLEELQGAFHFVEFVDEHVDMIMQAAREVTEEFVLEPNYEISEELKQRYMSGNHAIELSANAMQRANHYQEEIAKSTQAIAEWWSNNDGAVWEKMNVYEKEVLVERFLTGMSNGRHIGWDKMKHLPEGWEREVRAWTAEAGVAGVIINKMDFARLADEAVTTKFFGSKEEILKKRIDYEIGIASRRYEAANGKPPPQDMVNAWTKEVMRQIDPENAQLRGTMGAPRPAESIDRRVAYLKKRLTEAKIRAKIRKIVTEMN